MPDRDVLLRQVASAAVGPLSFYDHHRQSYGHMPINQERAVAEFMIGDYGHPGEDHGVDKGGEFGIYLYDFRGDKGWTPRLCAFGDSHGSLLSFLATGAWRRLCEASEQGMISDRADVTMILLEAGLYDRSAHPLDHRPVCRCCGRPVNA
jgi:hypothetical protein